MFRELFLAGAFVIALDAASASPVSVEPGTAVPPGFDPTLREFVTGAAMETAPGSDSDSRLLLQVGRGWDTHGPATRGWDPNSDPFVFGDPC